jgi:hypothetical protein
MTKYYKMNSYSFKVEELNRMREQFESQQASYIAEYYLNNAMQVINKLIILQLIIRNELQGYREEMAEAKALLEQKDQYINELLAQLQECQEQLKLHQTKSEEVSIYCTIALIDKFIA